MSAHSRRSMLRGLAGGGLVGIAGCLDRGDSVSILSAGSLATVLEQVVGRGFEAEHGTAYHGEYYGANAVMRMVEDGQKHPDVVISADNVLLRDRLYTDFTSWDVEFASNSLGLAYSPETWVGDRLAAGEPWYEIALEADAGEFAISDPDLDPLGYRAIHALQLAEDEHALDGFADSIGAKAYREPEEPQLLAGVETGNRAAAIAYRNMAVDHGLPFYEFPDTYNFADQAHANHYASVSYTTDEGYTTTGTPIVYNATVLDDADNPEGGREFITYLVDSSNRLHENGLTVGNFPTTYGEPPFDIRSP